MVRLNEKIDWTQVHEKQGIMWVASSPWTLHQERCSEQEHWIFHILQWRLPLDEVIKRFQIRFHPFSIDKSQLTNLIQKGLELGLLIETEPTTNPVTTVDRDAIRSASVRNTAPSLLENQPSASTLGVWAALVLKMFQSRVSLGSPQPYLVWLTPIALFAFGKKGMLTLLMLLLAAVGLIVTHWTELVSELPDWRSLKSPQVWLGFSLLFFATRALHELGHALACVRYKVRVVDCGLLSSFGLLCPYVDVSQSWKCDRPVQRMVIASGGVIAELWIAAIAAIIWSFSTDGWVHDFAFRTMLLCSLVTILFNANPLMKYDGYYVLSDLIGIQNLRDRTWQAFDSMLSGKSTEPAFSMLWMSLYSLASIANRIAIALAGCMFAYWIAAQWRLAMVGILVCGLYALSLLVVTWERRRKRQSVAAPHHGLLFRGVGWLSVICLCFLCLTMPLPSRVYSTGQIQLGEMIPIYAQEAGNVRILSIDANDAFQLTPGQLLLELDNQEIESELEAKLGKLILARHALESKNRQAFSDGAHLEEIPWLASQVQWLDRQVDALRSRQSKLSIRSSVQGVFTLAALPKSPDSRSVPFRGESLGNSRLSRHLEPGEWVRKGDLLGWIQPLGEPVAISNFSEDDIAKIRIGNAAKLRSVRFPSHVFEATVVDISKVVLKDSHSGSEKPYQVRFQLVTKSIGPRIAYLLDGSPLELIAHCSDRTLLDDTLDLVLRNFKVR